MKLLWPLAVLFVGCGGPNSVFREKCQLPCRNLELGCFASTVQKCVDDCTAQTVGLSSPCAQCVVEQSRSSGGTCSYAIGATTSFPCKMVCGT
jgi:hypothetical protein